MTVLDLTATIPSRIPDVLRALAQEAAHRSADPLNKLDENPAIGREWLIAELELLRCAEAMDKHFAESLSEPLPQREGRLTSDPC